MLGLITGVAASVGALTGGLSAWYEADQRRKEQEAHNKRVSDQLTNIKTQRDSVSRREHQTAGDFLNQYAMIRDPQRSAGIQQLYAQNRQASDRERMQLDAFGNELEATKTGVMSKSDVNFAGVLGTVSGGASGFAFGAGLEAEAAGQKSKNSKTSDGGVLDIMKNTPNYESAGYNNNDLFT